MSTEQCYTGLISRIQTQQILQDKGEKLGTWNYKYGTWYKNYLRQGKYNKLWRT